MESHGANVLGIRMRWLEHGHEHGQPVVFLHGLPTSPELWRAVIARLAATTADVRALAWELVGYGRSIDQGRDRHISVGIQSDFVCEWMDHIGLQRAVFVGHDIGGGIAQIIAARHPHRVSGLVLVNSVAYDNWPAPAVRALRRFAPIIRRLPIPMVYRLFVSFIRRGHETEEQTHDAVAVHWPHYGAVDGATALIRQAESLDCKDTLAIADRLAHLLLPVEIVWGASDPYLKYSSAQRLASDLNAPLDRVAPGRHFLPEDRPDRVAAAVQRVLSALPRKNVAA